MALYAMGDLHLSLNSDKSMDIFGDDWHDYVNRIREGFAPLCDDDVTVLRRPQLGYESGGIPAGFPIHQRPAGEEDSFEGQPRLLVEHRLENEAVLCRKRAGYHGNTP